jgi:hypothetical protein
MEGEAKPRASVRVIRTLNPTERCKDHSIPYHRVTPVLSQAGMNVQLRVAVMLVGPGWRRRRRLAPRLKGTYLLSWKTISDRCSAAVDGTNSDEKRRFSAADQRSFSACMGPYGQPSLTRCQYGITDRKTPQLPGARTCCDSVDARVYQQYNGKCKKLVLTR